MKPKVTCYWVQKNDCVHAVLSVEPPLNGFCSCMLPIGIPENADLEAAVREKAYWKLKQEVGELVVEEHYGPEDIELIDETPRPAPRSHQVEEPTAEDSVVVETDGQNSRIVSVPPAQPKKKKKR
jgi:hypothetical protein